MLDQIKELLDDVRPMSISAYLYGSQVVRPDPTNDVDLLFVVEPACKTKALTRIQAIQAKSDFLLHPTFVSLDMFERNPYFLVLVKKSVRLW